jgi:ribose transport system ATP-binding protein
VANGIAYLSEDRKHFGLVTGMSVRDNVTMASWNRFKTAGLFMKDSALLSVAQDYARRLKVKTPHVHQETRLLSGGNQQKIVIAKWLLRDCDILIFDEPTRGIDVGAKAEIYRLLEDLAAGGKAIIVISSELPEVLRLSHRIAVMCEGRITGELDGRTATQEDIMTLATRRAIAA